MKYIEDNALAESVSAKERLFRSLLSDLPHLKEIRSVGLMIALDFGDEVFREKVTSECVARGLVTESFLFCPTAMRIAPPLTITEEQIREVCGIVREVVEREA